MRLAWTLLQQTCLVLAQAIISQKNLDLSRGLGQRISPSLVLIHLKQKSVLFYAVVSAIYSSLKLFPKGACCKWTASLWKFLTGFRRGGEGFPQLLPQVRLLVWLMSPCLMGRCMQHAACNNSARGQGTFLKISRSLSCWDQLSPPK